MPGAKSDVGIESFMYTRPLPRRHIGLLFVIAAILAARVADGQSHYPATAAQPTWGGYSVGQPAYGQPGPAYTLPGQVALPPQTVVDPNTGQIWQTYPGQGGAMPGGIVPGGVAPGTSPAFPMQEPIYPPTPTPGGPESLLPPGTRDGVFQEVNFTTTWLPQLDNDSFGWTDVRTDVVLGLPFFTRETPIVITPAYELHFLDRPLGLDLPPRLNDLTIDFHHFRRIGDHWIADFAVMPGLFADDHSFDSSDAFRVNGRGLAIYEPSPEWKWILGVTYVDGGWSKVVPVAGFVYEPSDDVEYRLVFPSPKISWRLPQSPVPGQDEYWFYVEAEFANAIWAFEQTDGTPDVFAWRDYRVLMGLERKIIGGLSHRVEIGYVFHRQFKLASSPGDVDVDDTLMLRAGLTY